MFRSMRRAAQALTAQECEKVLCACADGVLALCGDGGYPYAVPLNYVYDGAQNVLYFHCATQGHKMDALRKCDKASFCVVEERTVDAPELSTRYRSVIAFGRVREVTDETRKREALRRLVETLAPGQSAHCIDQALGHVAVLALQVEHMTGKVGRLLLTAREQ